MDAEAAALQDGGTALTVAEDEIVRLKDRLLILGLAGVGCGWRDIGGRAAALGAGRCRDKGVICC